jgi:hypothetical protein
MQAKKDALLSKTYDVDDFVAAQEFYHSNGWREGLPVVPPIEAAVEACLNWDAAGPTHRDRAASRPAAEALHPS